MQDGGDGNVAVGEVRPDCDVRSTLMLGSNTARAPSAELPPRPAVGRARPLSTGTAHRRGGLFMGIQPSTCLSEPRSPTEGGAQPSCLGNEEQLFTFFLRSAEKRVADICSRNSVPFALGRWRARRWIVKPYCGEKKCASCHTLITIKNSRDLGLRFHEPVKYC